MNDSRVFKKNCIKDLKQHYVEIGFLCNLSPPTVSEGNTTVVNTKVCNNLSDLLYVATTNQTQDLEAAILRVKALRFC